MVFERATQYPTTEEHIWETPMPRSAYGFSKMAGEVWCRAAHDEHGLPYTICRPFNAYGPGEMPDDEPGIAHAVPDLIRKCLSGQHPLEIFGDGTQTRTLTHIDDIADGVVAAMHSPAGLNEHFNISAAQELTVAEIARIVWEACDRDPAGVRARAPAVVHRRRGAPLARREQGARDARLGSPDRRPRGRRADRRVAARAARRGVDRSGAGASRRGGRRGTCSASGARGHRASPPAERRTL